MTFLEKMRLRQARTGKPYHQLCREMGSAGGRKSAWKRRQCKQALACKLAAQQAEKLRQVAQRVESPEALPESALSGLGRLRLRRLALRRGRTTI